MRIRHLLILVSVFFLQACEREIEPDLSAVPAGALEHGVGLMATHCHTCHRVDDLEMDKMLAPPLWGVRAHYLSAYPEPLLFVHKMVEFIMAPHSDNSLMPIEVGRYGLKSPVSLSEEEIRLVVWTIYAGGVQRPVWSREYKKRHRGCDAVW